MIEIVFRHMTDHGAAVETVRTETGRYSGVKRYQILARRRSASNCSALVVRAKTLKPSEGQADAAVLASLVLDLADFEGADFAGARDMVRRRAADQRPRSQQAHLAAAHRRLHRHGAHRRGRAASSSAVIQRGATGWSSVIKRPDLARRIWSLSQPLPCEVEIEPALLLADPAAGHRAAR